MASLVYSLCAIASVLCAIVLVTSYRKTPTRLLFLSVLCFCGLSINNLLLYADFMYAGSTGYLSLYRHLTGAVSVLLLLVGLIWGNERD